MTWWTTEKKKSSLLEKYVLYTEYLRVMMCPLAQKHATQMPGPACTTSARSTNDVSVMLCLKMQVCEGSEMTLACFSEHSTIYRLSFRSCEVEGETDTGLLLLTLSFSSLSEFGSYHGSEAAGSSEPDPSKNAIRTMLPLSLVKVPEQTGMRYKSDN